MPSSTLFSVPRSLFLSQIQKFIPKSWKQATEQLDKPTVSGDASMIGSLHASLKEFVRLSQLSNAFKIFSQIQDYASCTGSFDHILHPISSLLLSCINLKSLAQGKQLHAQIISLGFDQHPILVSRIITFYANVNLLADAHVATENSNSLDPLHWNLLISSYVRNGLFVEAISAYKQMINKQVKPDDYTYPTVLKACGEVSDRVTGMEVHKSIVASSLEWSLIVHNALISMYGRFGEVEVACRLFNGMPARDSVSWNTMISIYASRGMWEEAFQLFESMCEESIEVGIITWNTIAGGCLRTTNFRRALSLLSQMRTSIHHLDSVSMAIGLNACSHIGALKLGKEIHGHAVRTCSDVFDNIQNALITMYSRCRDLRHAYTLFHKIEEKSVITWNAMLSGYAYVDQYEEVSFLFREMFQQGAEPNYVTIASILPLCARIANLQHGKEFHCYIMKRGEFKDLLLLWNALLDMYARSGKILEARRVFDSLNARDEVTYTSMIAGYGMTGDGETALKLFEEMCKVGIKPDHITMIAVLSACSHSRLLAQGQLLFKKMSDVFGIRPRLEHYSCMVDLFGRAGLLNKALEVITSMPYKPTPAMWATLIGACRIHGNMDMGEWAAGKLLEMKPNHSGYYVLIANMYAAAGCWNKLANVRTCMRDLGVRKAPGCAWVDVGNEFAPFLVGDTNNPRASEIYPVMDGLNELMKDAGYVRGEEFVSSEEDFEELHVLGNVY
ncbi:pentatricopeptide repeat-containing protein [Senna tora]|uniref:Pentatricopeptide repeat-containing protein n=1 Tax=Senna tora TaxID=362788 RepID=A0A834X4W9_9FABA|nr:pentatricopeptide repeat-containing protein [Senna tora]